MNTSNNIRRLQEGRSQGEYGLAVVKSDDMDPRTAELHFTVIERAKDKYISFGELKHVADRTTDIVNNAIQTFETLRADLERMTVQRDQLEAEIKDLQENANKEMAVRDAEIEKLKNELQRETTERKAIADLLLNSFSNIQSVMAAVEHTDKDLLDTQNLKRRTNQPTSRYRWLKIAGLCLFVGITLYANKEDAVPIIGDAREFQIEVSSNISECAEPAYYKAIKDASTKYALDPNLIATIIYVESGGNIKAVSQKGAKGLMQLTPEVYKQYNVGDPFDIEQNIFSGTAYLASLLQRFDGNLEQALAAYNCGPTRVIEYKGIPPIKETQEYVERIMAFYLRGEVPTGFIKQDS
jgi:hypothetical protein